MLISGKVIRKIQGFYFVYTNFNFNSIEDFEEKLLKCKLRGTLKESNNKQNCIIGDIVQIDTELNVIESIEERENFLERPLISNIDYIALCFAAKNPDFDVTQLQKYLLSIHKNHLNSILLISKSDLLDNVEKENIEKEISENFPYLKLFFLSKEDQNSLDAFKAYIKGKDVIIAGPSGVGKSTLINNLLNKEVLKTGQVSAKTKKGKNTTIDTRFFPYEDGFLIDTPGFSSIEFPRFKNELEIRDYFPEIMELSNDCKFTNCIHVTEPNCNVKEKLKPLRYEFYTLLLKNIKNGGY